MAMNVLPLGENDPRAFGQFRLTGRLGSGGMGEAFLAEAPDSGWVVVKTVRLGGPDTAEFTARMAHEVEALRRINSPLVPRVIHTALGADRPWFAMEFMKGLTLRQRVHGYGPVPTAELRPLALELAHALEALQAAHVIHRDIKPENVVVTEHGPRLIDFGTAALHDATKLTATGSVVGSLRWMSPEQVQGAEPTSAVDVHAWGLLMLHAATGEEGFAADTNVATMYRIVHETPQVPAALGPVTGPLVAQALSKDPRQRPTARDLVAMLGQVGAVDPPEGQTQVLPWPDETQVGHSPRRRWALVAIAASAAGLLLAAMALAGTLPGRATAGDEPAPTPSASAEPSASPSPSDSPSPTPTTWDEAKASFADYRDDLPGTWSRTVPGGTFAGAGPTALALQLYDDELVMHTFSDGRWSASRKQGAGQPIEEMSTQVVDTTGGGGADILATITLEDGTETGTVLFNFGRFATFRDEEKVKHWYLPGLAMVDGKLRDAADDLIVYQDGKARFKMLAPDPWDLAEQSFGDYRASSPGAWSPMVPGSAGLDAVAVEGRDHHLLVHAFTNGGWREVEDKDITDLTLGDFEFEVADTTGGGGADILVKATIEEGDSVGTVALNTGRLAGFRIDDAEYPMWRGLAWDGTALADADGSQFTFLPEDSDFEVTR